MTRGKMKGLTLIELLVVLALIVILSSFSVGWLKGMVKKHYIATDIQTIFSALNQARVIAFSHKRTCGLFLGNGTSTFSFFELRCDTDHDGDIENGFEIIQHIELKKIYTSNKTKISFSKEGFTNQVTTIHPLSSDVLPANSCIKVSNTRIKIGIWQNGDCKIQ